MRKIIQSIISSLVILMMVGTVVGYSYTNTGFKAPWFATDDGTFNTSLNTYAAYPIDATNATQFTGKNVANGVAGLDADGDIYPHLPYMTYLRGGGGGAIAFLSLEYVGLISWNNVDLGLISTTIQDPHTSTESQIQTQNSILAGTNVSITKNANGTISISSTDGGAETDPIATNASNITSGTLSRKINITSTAGQGLIVSNVNMRSEGVYVRSVPASSKAGGYGNASIIGEILPPAGYVGDAVGIYGGAVSANAGHSMWGSNTVTTANTGFNGTMFGTEIDMNIYSALCPTAPYCGIGGGITGFGTSQGLYGNWITRADATSNWFTGLQIDHVTNGIGINATQTGISVRNATTGQTFVVSASGEIISINLAGTGNAFVCVNANGYFYRSASACV